MKLFCLKHVLLFSVHPKKRQNLPRSAGFPPLVSQFSLRALPSHLAGALHAGVLCRNRLRHHGQDALRRLAVTVQTGGTGRPGDAVHAGYAARSPLSVAAVRAVRRSAGITWQTGSTWCSFGPSRRGSSVSSVALVTFRSFAPQ